VASIEKRTGSNGKPEYRARWRDADGKSRRSRWYSRKLDADKLRATVEADLHRGTYVDQNNPVTVAEFARSWVAARPHRPRTKTWYDALIRNHFEGTRLGSRPLVKVRPSEIQAYATDRAQVLGPYALRIHMGVLRSIFAAAVLDGILARNPVLPRRHLQLPKDERQPVVPLTVEQVRALATAMPDRYRAMVIAQAGLGLRVSELLALRVSDVDFLRRTARVEHQLEHGTLRRVPPKTPKSRRTIPLPQVVAEALAQQMAAYPPADDGTLFTMAPATFRYKTTPPGRPRVMTKETPERIHHQRYGDHLRAAAKRAGLPATTTHDLRHHYASVLLHAGESVHAVAERLGHVDPTLVLTTYGHLMPDTEDRTRRAVDAAWAEEADRQHGTG
jgi:integrase